MLVLLSIFFIYFNNTYFVHASTNSFYSQLKDTLAKRGFSNNVIVVSTKRLKIHNDLLVKYSSAAKESSHLIGNAIDFIVFDINKDGKANEVDIDIVFEILDKEIIKNKGGIGTYKNESSFISKQMIHIDARGHKARWAY
jgi:uncharacterized protein YcbK (DUF882 family)